MVFTRKQTIIIIAFIVFLLTIPAFCSAAYGSVTITATGSGTYFFGGSIPLSGTGTAGNTIYLYLTNNYDGSWVSSATTVGPDNTWSYNWVPQQTYFESTRTHWQTGTYTFKAVDSTTGAYSTVQVFIQQTPIPAPTIVPTTEVPCSVSIHANQDTVIQSMPVILSGYSSRSDAITLSVIEKGSPLSGVIFAQVYPSPATHIWSYVWNPVGLSGYSFQTGQYTILATNLCAAQDTTVINIVQGTVTISASGPQNYYKSETITFSGTCTQGNSVQLILTGPGLPSDGVPLTMIQKNSDNTWSYIWTAPFSIRGYPIMPGTYTVYAYDSSGQVYGTVPIILQSNSQPAQSTINETVNPVENSTLSMIVSNPVTPVPTVSQTAAITTGQTTGLTTAPAATAIITPNPVATINSSVSISKTQGNILDLVINFYRNVFGWK